MYGGGFSRRGRSAVCFGVAWMVGRGVSIGPSSTVHVSVAVHVCAIRCVGDVSVSNRCTRSLWFRVDPFVRNATCASVHHDLIEYSSPPTYRRAFPPRSCSSASRILFRRSNRPWSESCPSRSRVSPADVSSPLGLAMCSAPVTEPTGVSSVSDVCLSVYTHPLDAEAEGSDRRALSMFRGRSVRRHDFPRLYLLMFISSPYTMCLLVFASSLCDVGPVSRVFGRARPRGVCDSSRLSLYRTVGIRPWLPRLNGRAPLYARRLLL